METAQTAGHKFNICKTHFYQRNGHRSIFYRKAAPGAVWNLRMEEYKQVMLLQLATNMHAKEHQIRQLEARETGKSHGTDEKHFKAEVDVTDSWGF